VNDDTYKLDDLARAGGTSARTVRYYVQRGLIPAPAFKGKDTAYGHEHLVRLRAIKRLQEAFFPLDAIAVELERRPLSDLERIADGKDLEESRRSRSLGVGGDSPLVGAEPQDSPSLAPAASMSAEIRQTLAPDASSGRRNERVFRRIELAPGVELSIAEDAPTESKRIIETILRARGMSNE
jgi:DNA-binding transcriptional MerR regulator